MKSIKKQYRTSYVGETVITSMTYEGGNWNYQRENVPNAVTNNQISNRAVIIGNGESRQGFNLGLLKNHRGGLLGSAALQTYGCNALYRDFAPHFLVVTGDEIVKEIADSDYCGDHIVYAGSKDILDYPGKFYLTPQDPSWNAGAIAAYLACFDGHRKIYLIGFDGVDTASSGYNIYKGTRGYADPVYGFNEYFWVQSMMAVFTTYNDVEFVRVMPTPDYRIPEPWKYLANFRQIDYRQFAIEADL